MALSFPLSPSIGQIYIAPNGVTYVWNGTYWAAESSGGGSGGGGGGGPNPFVYGAVTGAQLGSGAVSITGTIQYISAT